MHDVPNSDPYYDTVFAHISQSKHIDAKNAYNKLNEVNKMIIYNIIQNKDKNSITFDDKDPAIAKLDLEQIEQFCIKYLPDTCRKFQVLISLTDEQTVQDVGNVIFHNLEHFDLKRKGCLTIELTGERTVIQYFYNLCVNSFEDGDTSRQDRGRLTRIVEGDEESDQDPERSGSEFSGSSSSGFNPAISNAQSTKRSGSGSVMKQFMGGSLPSSSSSSSAPSASAGFGTATRKVGSQFYAQGNESLPSSSGSSSSPAGNPTAISNFEIFGDLDQDSRLSSPERTAKKVTKEEQYALFR